MSKEKKTFSVSMCRIGYGHATFTVEARSDVEAREIALDKAGNYSYSEHSSEYKIDTVIETKELTSMKDLLRLSDRALKYEFRALYGAETFDDVDTSLSTLRYRGARLALLEQEAERRGLPVQTWIEETERSSSHYCSGAPYP